MKYLAITIAFSILAVCPTTSRAAALPTAAEVGPEAMPAEIAPVDPPFEMPQPVRPKFADHTATVAGLEGRQLATKIIQRAIDETASSGGGTVVIPPGRWRTGRIELKSGVNLHVGEGAELHFSGQIEDYLPVVFSRYEGLEVMALGGLIYAHNQANIALTGRGKLFGPEEGPLREARPGLSDQVVDSKLPIEERVFDGREGRHYFRPYFVCLVNCRNVLIEGVSFAHGPMWNVVPIYCENVVVRGVSVESRGVVNGDGVNVESSRNVLVEYCRVNTGDDCYALKAGRNADGLRTAEPVENVIFRYNHAVGGFGGVTCGSETAGTIRNVYVHDCVFENVRHAAYLKTRRPRGGGVERLTIERVRFSAYNHAIFFDMIGSPLYVGELGNRLPRRELTPATPFYRDIVFRDLVGTCPHGEALKIKGIPESPAKSVLLERIDITGQGLVNLADVENLTIRDSKFRSEEPTIRLLDAVGVNFDRCELKAEQGKVRVDVEGATSRDIRFQACSPEITSKAIHQGADVSTDAVHVEP